MYQVFISYSRKDAEFAKQLANALEKQQISVWIDVDDISAGSNWSNSIQSGLDQSEILLLVISPDSTLSENVANEWQYFFDQKKPIIPILWKPAKVHFQLSRLQYVDFNNQAFDKALGKLLDQLGNRVQGRGTNTKSLSQAALPVDKAPVLSNLKQVANNTALTETNPTKRLRLPLLLSGLTALLVVAVVVIILRNISESPRLNSQDTTLTHQVIAITPSAIILTNTVPTGFDSWFGVYFSNLLTPVPGKSSIDDEVVQALDDAKNSIALAAFDFTLPSVANALVRAKQRGLNVRVVMDIENGTYLLKANKLPDQTSDFDAVQTLRDARIPVVDGGHASGLMHNEFIIIDDQMLFTGSWNPSYNDTYRNDNNLVKILNPTLAKNYAAKFNEMFVDKRFGTKAQIGAQTAELTIGDTPVRNYFAPVDNPLEKIIAVVNNAERSIKFMSFVFSDSALSGAMIQRANSGVNVRGVMENVGSSQGRLPDLYCSELPDVKVDGNSYIMHHKVIIIDDAIVIMGSFNFSNNSNETNDENVLIIYNPEAASLFNKEFDRVYGLGIPVKEIGCENS